MKHNVLAIPSGHPDRVADVVIACACPAWASFRMKIVTINVTTKYGLI